MHTDTRQLSYRQELDILEDLADMLKDGSESDLNLVRDQIADQWPEDAYNLRVIQWLHAGSPDLDEVSLGDAYDHATDMIARSDRNSITKSVHAMLGLVLYGMASDYITDVFDPWSDTPAEALAKVTEAIADHRADLMQHDGHAMTPPYQFQIWQGYDHTYTIHVTETN
jgi:hypothetical protein